jgi:hypothetical protein
MPRTEQRELDPKTQCKFLIAMDAVLMCGALGQSYGF